MKEHDIEAAFKRLQAPAPDPEVRLRAKRAALEEFARLQAANDQTTSKDEQADTRLSRRASPRGRDHMTWTRNTKWLAAAASACIAVVGLAVVWPILRDGGGERLLEHTPQVAPPGTDTPVASGGNSTDTAEIMTQGPTASEPATGLEPGSIPAAAPAPDAQVSVPAESDARHERIAREERAAEPERRESASAKQQAVTGGAAAPGPEEEVVVQGLPSSLQSSLEARRGAGAVADAAQSQPAPPPAVPAAQQASAEERVQAEEIMVTGSRATSRPAGSPKNAATRAGRSDGAVRAYRPVLSDAASNDVVMVPMPAEGRDKFAHVDSNPVKQVAAEPVSTFSADVDTASYSFVRRMLNSGALPPKDAVRPEEMINYFDYGWPAATSKSEPFRPTVVVSDSPWAPGRKLVHIGIKGYEVPASERPHANLVLLIDVSGSMSSPDRLPLVKDSIRLMLGQLRPSDTVALVVYAGAAGLVLPSTPVAEKQKILEALDRLQAGGSTAGAAGIQLAYEVAEGSFRKDGVNRILLATDGDFNVGIDGTEQLKDFVERKREKGVFLSVLGFGQGNYRDELAQALAQNGNGVAAYIDTLQEAQKVLVQEASASLFTIAKDVKLQVEFNPATVAEYRLVGYETRALKREDFNNDAVDAGDVGAGHTVTAIYEITPVGAARSVDQSRYQQKTEREPKLSDSRDEYGFLKIRYKLPDSSTSRLIEQPIRLRMPAGNERIAEDVQFSTAVAGFAQMLRGAQFTGPLTFDDVIKQALASRGADEFGYRNEFVQLVRRAQSARKM